MNVVKMHGRLIKRNNYFDLFFTGWHYLKSIRSFLIPSIILSSSSTPSPLLTPFTPLHAMTALNNWHMWRVDECPITANCSYMNYFSLSTTPNSQGQRWPFLCLLISSQVPNNCRSWSSRYRKSWDVNFPASMEVSKGKRYVWIIIASQNLTQC